MNSFNMITPEQHREIEARLERNRKPRERSQIYDFGFDAGRHGANTENSDSRIFSSKEQTAEWQRGYDDAKSRVTNPIQKNCDHKFVDSNHCLKCGWTPPVSAGIHGALTSVEVDILKNIAGVEDEIRDLHFPIKEFCREKGWVYFYSNPRRKTGRTLGEPDFTILADLSRVFFIECKSAGEELSPGQEIMKTKALYLGHTIETVYTMDQFYRIVK